MNRKTLNLFNNYDKYHDTNVIALYIENDIINLLDWKALEIQKHARTHTHTYIYICIYIERDVPATCNGDSIHWRIYALPVTRQGLQRNNALIIICWFLNAMPDVNDVQIGKEILYEKASGRQIRITSLINTQIAFMERIRWHECVASPWKSLLGQGRLWIPPHPLKLGSYEISGLN